MTVKEIEQRIRTKITDTDNEVAHIEEDQLHQDVLAAIRDGRCEDHVTALAAAALKTQDIKFIRWHA